jgi:hypothetical protein
MQSAVSEMMSVHIAMMRVHFAMMSHFAHILQRAAFGVDACQEGHGER